MEREWKCLKVLTNFLRTFPEIHRFRPVNSDMFTHLLQITFIRLSTVFAKGWMVRGFRFSSRPHGFFFVTVNVVFSPSNVVCRAPVVLYFVLKIKGKCWRFIGHTSASNYMFRYLFESLLSIKVGTSENKRLELLPDKRVQDENKRWN